MEHSTIVAALLGVLEGLTEFIPVSSTGHVLLAGHFLGFDSPGRAFEVLIQLGAILAILGVYAGRLWRIFSTAPRDPRARRFILSVLVAFLPAVVVGVIAHDFIKTVLFETPALIAVMLILGGIVLLFVDRLATAPRYAEAEDLPLFAASKKVYPQSVSGPFRRLKWALLVLCLAIYYLLPFLRWDRGPNLPNQAVLLDLANNRFYFFFIEIWPQEFFLVAGLLVMAGGFPPAAKRCRKQEAARRPFRSRRPPLMESSP